MKKYVMTYSEFNEQLNNKGKINTTGQENITEIKEEIGSSPNIHTDTSDTSENDKEDEKEEEENEEDNITPIQ